MLNWIVWNRTDYLYKDGFGIKNYKGWYAIKPKQPTNLFSKSSSLWENGNQLSVNQEENKS